MGEADTAVYLQQVIPVSARVEIAAAVRDLPEHIGDKWLSRKARIHRHEQYTVRLVQNVVQCGQRRRRIERGYGMRAESTDPAERTVQMGGGFRMDRHIFARLNVEPVELALRLRDHQMDVERNIGQRAQSAAKVRTEREIRHKAPVHNVDVERMDPAVREYGKHRGQMRDPGTHHRGREPGRQKTVLRRPVFTLRHSHYQRIISR